MKTDLKEKSGKPISRKEALMKAGKYAAFTAAAAVVMLAPKKAQALSGITNPGGGWGTGPVSPPGGGTGGNKTPFTKPEQTSPKSGLRDSPWK